MVFLELTWCLCVCVCQVLNPNPNLTECRKVRLSPWRCFKRITLCVSVCLFTGLPWTCRQPYSEMGTLSVCIKPCVCDLYVCSAPPALVLLSFLCDACFALKADGPGLDLTSSHTAQRQADNDADRPVKRDQRSLCVWVYVWVEINKKWIVKFSCFFVLFSCPSLLSFLFFVSHITHRFTHTHTPSPSSYSSFSYTFLLLLQRAT